MTKTRVKNIDKEMCGRVRTAFKRLGMTFDGISADSGISSRAQLVDISNGRIEPSKKVLRYLCSKGFSAQWLLVGEGPQLWLGASGNTGDRKTIISQIKKDIDSLSKTVEECSARIDDFRAILADITGSKPVKPR